MATAIKKTFSIIVPVKNLRTITQVCFDSIIRYTRDYELIIIDDGSGEKTKKFLEGIQGGYLIRNEKSVGWCESINQGSENATGEYVIFLNNDVVVTPEWAEKMVAHFEKDKKLGILSCTTNRVDGYQHIDFNKKGVGFQYADALTGFCLMLRKDVFDKLKEQDGYWLDSKSFGLGGQDDADICYRVRGLGYKVGIARDVFIYHYGSATFREEFDNDAEYSHKYARSRVEILRNKYKSNKNMTTEQSIKAQENNVNKPLVMIAIPTLTGSIKVGLAIRLIQWSHNPNYKVIIEPLEGVYPLDSARSQLVNKFMEVSTSPDDRLCFLDDDVVPPSNALDKLVEADKDVIGALCFMLKADDSGIMAPVPIAVRYNEKRKYVIYFDGKGVTEVDATGGGCIMVKRKVYEEIDTRAYERHYYPDGTVEMEADFDFCQKVQKAGMKVYVDFSTICEHIKPVGLRQLNDLMLKVQREKR